MHTLVQRKCKPFSSLKFNIVYGSGDSVSLIFDLVSVVQVSIACLADGFGLTTQVL